MNKEQISKILEEIYAIDPSLRREEEKLVRIITELSARKPEVSIDPEFMESLRTRLSAMARTAPVRRSHFFGWQTAYGIAGLALIILVVFGLGRMPQKASLFNGEVKIVPAAESAFGKLSIPPMFAGGKGGGGEGAGGSASALSAGLPDTMPAGMVKFEFAYKGGDFELPGGNVPVYKRLTGSMGGSEIMESLKGANLGLADLRSFSNTKLDNFTIYEDKGHEGYYISVNMKDESVSINDQWLFWRLYQNCGGKVCDKNPITPSEIPSDSELANITDAFLAEHNIPRTGYGAPVVPRQWQKAYEASGDKAHFALPEVVDVIYPLLLNGRPAIDTQGDGWGLGLSVSVNVREKKVNAVYAKTNVYQESGYPAQTDKDKILEFAKTGGLIQQYAPANYRTITLELGTPKQVQARIWTAKEDGQTEELIVSALEFPVLNADQGEARYFGRDNIVVPIVKDINYNFMTGPRIY